MHFIAALTVVSSFLVLSGCAGMEASPPVPREQAFNEQDLAPYGGKGTSSISGEAFLKMRDGSVKKAAGETVWLVPSVPYLDEYVKTEILQGRKLSPGLEKGAFTYMRTTKANSEGRFRFEDIPPGTYHVYSLITWSVGEPGTRGMSLETITVKPNEQASVVVTY
jgi:hypothetical protein